MSKNRIIIYLLCHRVYLILCWYSHGSVDQVMTITIDYENNVRTLMVHNSPNTNKTNKYKHFKSIKKSSRHNTMNILILIWNRQQYDNRLTPFNRISSLLIIGSLTTNGCWYKEFSIPTKFFVVSYVVGL